MRRRWRVSPSLPCTLRMLQEQYVEFLTDASERRDACEIAASACPQLVGPVVDAAGIPYLVPNGAELPPGTLPIAD